MSAPHQRMSERQCWAHWRSLLRLFSAGEDSEEALLTSPLPPLLLLLRRRCWCRRWRLLPSAVTSGAWKKTAKEEKN